MFLVFSLYFFFSKQKTAYELRISDWSSDVCSSDLDGAERIRRHARRGRQEIARRARDHDVDLAPRSVNRGECGFDGGIVADVGGGAHRLVSGGEIGSASCRERVCQVV